MAAHCDSDQSIKLSVTTCSDQSVVRSPRHPSIETRVCLVSTACQNESLIQALKKVRSMEVLVVHITSKGASNKKKYLHSYTDMSIDVPYLTSHDGSEYASCEDPRFETVFVLEEFEGEIFNRLKQYDCRILGSPVVMHVASTNEPLPYTYRPQYCSCMQGLILCFSNFKTKEHLTRLVTLCHNMGACVRKDMSAKVTFLVTNLLHGPKYRTAVSLGIPVVKEDWVHMCWAARRRCGVHGSDDEFVLPCKSKPFEGCTLSFLGFSEKESKHMQEQAVQQGAKVAEVGDASCSHLVVEEDNVKSLPFHPQERLFVVIQEWFWGSIQIEARAAESMYYFEVAEQRPMMTRSSTTSSLLGTPQKWRDSNGQSGVSRTSSSKYSFCRKRSRLREETLAKLSQDSEQDSTKQPPTKRPSTDTSTCISESLLDISNNTTTVRSPRGQDLFKGQRPGARKANPLSKRRFELSLVEAHSPRGGTPVKIKDREGSRRCTGKTSRKTTEIKSTKQGPRRSSRLVRKRKSTEFDKDLSVVANKGNSAGADTSEAEGPSELEGSTAKKRRRVRQRRRMSLGPLQLSNQTRRFFRRLSSSSFYQETLSPAEDGPSTIVEDSESGGFFEDTLREAEKSASPVLHSRISQGQKAALGDSVGVVIQDEDAQNGKKAVSARYQVAMEFLQTETNYVGILSTILNVFKQPLEDPKQAGGPILPSENIKAIFGSLPEIHSVHTRMAADLSKVMCSWEDSSCIGCIVKKYATEFVRCYPPFVNFFEMAKETISSCEASLPRFHAFLKINQAKKECGRQTLAELLINPVQRLPRIILLLQDIKKHTERENESHPDVAGIQSALDEVKEVMTHINEDKRKTESQKQIFDIVYEVDGCPPTIVSSHREFITRAELISVDDNLSSKGDHICLFLFSDCVELAKRKRGIKSHSFKSPNVHARPPGAVRCLKHIKLISLSHIKKVVNIKNSEDCQSAFSLFCRTPTDTQDWLYTFKMLSCTSDCGQNSENKDQQSNATLTHDEGKTRLLQLLSRHRANTVCKASDDNFVHTVASHELDISTSDVGSTIGRAVRAAKKSHKKLTRVFSFSRTPRHAVQRAVSNMMSPSSRAALPASEHITPGLGTTPSRAAQATSRLYGSQLSVNSYDMDDQDCIASSSGLTPSMSVSNICTPQRDRRGNRLSSTASLKVDEENLYPGSRYGLKPSVSMMTLDVPPEKPMTRAATAVKNDVFQVPTPPVRRRRVGAAKTMKAATVALGRMGSFRRKNKGEAWV